MNASGAMDETGLAALEAKFPAVETVVIHQMMYKGFGNFDSCCYMKLWRKENVLLLRELEDNPGTSVTNYSEYLATMIAKIFKLDKNTLQVFENYYNQPNYDKVIYEIIEHKLMGEEPELIFIHPTWRPATLEETAFLTKA